MDHGKSKGGWGVGGANGTKKKRLTPQVLPLVVSRMHHVTSVFDGVNSDESSPMHACCVSLVRHVYIELAGVDTLTRVLIRSRDPTG